MIIILDMHRCGNWNARKRKCYDRLYHAIIYQISTDRRWDM